MDMYSYKKQWKSIWDLGNFDSYRKYTEWVQIHIW